ncbi:MAG: hypothetical protein IJR27_06685 [Synergistaceae bacterium]|nr:hypothetical protein [Synergistaceae bacterium]MBQ9574945.1 hypothetical protein [Synergistaceae bacterium]
MSDLAVNVTWQEILNETSSGNIPHCRAIASPLKWHDEIIETLAGMILGTWRASHPDLIITGTSDKPPKIDECRELIAGLALKPMEAQRRLAVIRCADKLNVQAANSLLKLAEEPPEHAVLLFLMEDGRLFLPTLRSRSRFSTLISDEVIVPRSIPLDPVEWVNWLGNAYRNNDTEMISNELASWSSYMLEAGQPDIALTVEKLRIISSQKNLSSAMLCDLILLTLREGTENIEHILNDIR